MDSWRGQRVSRNGAEALGTGRWTPARLHVPRPRLDRRAVAGALGRVPAAMQMTVLLLAALAAMGAAVWTLDGGVRGGTYAQLCQQLGTRARQTVGPLPSYIRPPSGWHDIGTGETRTCERDAVDQLAACMAQAGPGESAASNCFATVKGRLQSRLAAGAG